MERTDLQLPSHCLLSPAHSHSPCTSHSITVGCGTSVFKPPTLCFSSLVLFVGFGMKLTVHAERRLSRTRSVVMVHRRQEEGAMEGRSGKRDYDRGCTGGQPMQA
ncbi:hypothetical protein JZ751_018852 [Albula glossodonta]|uniref:Uncharacterized protein n=1 Tax=Albula glossodonta TaxID=121402 RepID=A0A8T2N1G8_9TELE|nr:hypothetical protein JZ751_018852 [Albula glossodonta]